MALFMNYSLLQKYLLAWVLKMLFSGCSLSHSVLLKVKKYGFVQKCLGLARKTFAASDSHPCISQHFSDLPSQQQSQMGLHSEVFCWASVVAYSKQGTARISRLIKALGVYFWFLFSETSFRCSQRSGLPKFSLQPLFCITVVYRRHFYQRSIHYHLWLLAHHMLLSMGIKGKRRKKGSARWLGM